MAQSIRSKLDGSLPEFLEDVRVLGRWEAMRKWKLERSYLPVARIILEETGDENFGVNPTARSYLSGGIQGLLRELVQAFAGYVIQKEVENEQLKRIAGIHEHHDKKLERQAVSDITGLIEALKSSVPEHQKT